MLCKVGVRCFASQRASETRSQIAACIRCCAFKVLAMCLPPLRPVARNGTLTWSSRGPGLSIYTVTPQYLLAVEALVSSGPPVTGIRPSRCYTFVLHRAFVQQAKDQEKPVFLEVRRLSRSAPPRRRGFGAVAMPRRVLGSCEPAPNG